MLHINSSLINHAVSKKITPICMLMVGIILFVSQPQNMEAQPKFIQARSRALWGCSKTNCMSGDRIYIAGGGAIVIGRYISIDSVNILNEYYLPSTVQDLKARGDTLFASDLLTGLYIIDMTDIEAPREIGHLNIGVNSYGMALDSNQLYLSHGTSVSKIDITYPFNPVISNVAQFKCDRLRIFSRYLYCISERLITIATTSTLDSVGSIPVDDITPFGNNFVGLEFTDSKGILIENHSGDVPGPNSLWAIFTQLDISNPEFPARGSTFRLPYLKSFTNRNDTLYCITDEDSLYVIDAIFNPKPFVISKVPNLTADYLSINNTLLLASVDYRSKFQIVNVTDPTNPVPGYSLPTMAELGSVVAADSFVIAGRMIFPGLAVVNVNSPEKPRKQNWYTDSINSVRAMKIYKGYLFTATGYGLKVFDFQNPDGLKLIGELNYGEWAQKIDVSDTIAVLGGGSSQVHLVSVADYAHPKYILSIPNSSIDYMTDLFIRDTILFVSGDYRGVRAYSISSPDHPYLLWELSSFDCKAIYPIGKTLFVSGRTIITIYDIESVNEPKKIGDYAIHGGGVYDIFAFDELLFLALSNGMRILFFDKSDSLIEVAWSNTPGSNAICADGHNVFLSDNQTGVYIYHFGDIYADISYNETYLPNRIALYQNYPNPFNPSTQITYSVPKTTEVILKVYDLLGREVCTLVNERKPAGEYSVTWDAVGIPTGVYFYRIVAGEYMETKKMVFIR